MNKFIGIVILIYTCIFFALAEDIVDVSQNYSLFNEVQFVVGNSYLPLYVDNTFQPKAVVNELQLVVVCMFASATTPDYIAKKPYLEGVSNDSKAFAFFQSAVEKNILDGNTKNGKVPLETAKAIVIIKKLFPKIDTSSWVNDKELLSREKLLLILKKDQSMLNKVSEYEKNIIKKEKKYVGAAVSEFVMGNAKSLENIELSKYRNKNKVYEDIFWELASDRDSEYQLANEDLSNDNLDLLTKRLNKALLSFYDSQFWLTIEECNLILKEDSRNVGALSLKGSAYYMLQNYEKAKKYWQRVLVFQPYNEEIRYFLDMIK